MLITTDHIFATLAKCDTQEERELCQKEFRKQLLERIKGQVETIRVKLEWPYRSNPSETPLQQLAFLYELLDCVMANEAIAPDEVYSRKRKEQAKKAEIMLRESLVSKDMV